MTDPAENIRPGTRYEGDHSEQWAFDEGSGLPPGWSITYNDGGAPEQVAAGRDISEYGRDAGAGADAQRPGSD